MKKRILAFMLAAMMTMTMFGCGVNETGTNKASSASFDLNVSDYVTLCDYSKVPVTITTDYTIDDQDIQDYMEGWYSYYGPFYTEDILKTTVGEGDIVNVDYVGKLDGVAFSGGTAVDQNIDVDGNCAAGGASSYIEGFTDGLKGATVGSIIDCDVTFPTEYPNNPDLAGKDVVFTFTVNSIQKELRIEDIDDAFVQENMGYDTVDEMYEELRASLEESMTYYKEQDINQQIRTYLMENSTVEVPEDYLEARVNDYRNVLIESYCEGDESKLENYVSTNMSMTLEEAEQSWKESMTESISLEFILGAIAAEKSIMLNEVNFEAHISELVNSYASYGITDATGIYEIYGYGDAEYGEEYLKTTYVAELALEEIAKTADITVDLSAAEE